MIYEVNGGAGPTKANGGRDLRNLRFPLAHAGAVHVLLRVLARRVLVVQVPIRLDAVVGVEARLCGTRCADAEAAR